MNTVETGVFVQYISDGGYEILKDKGLQYIVPRNNNFSPQTDILEKCHTLFTEFAGLTGIEGVDCLIQFANTYGLLKPFKEHTSLSPGSIKVKISTPRETCTFWSTESSLLDFMLRSWQNLDNKKTDIDNRKQTYINSLGYEQYKHLLQSKKELPIGEFTTTLSEKFLVQQTINVKLKEYPVIPCLLFDKKNNLRQYFRPTSLLSLMWFQFFRYITGEQQVKQCPICNKWYDISDENGSPRWNERCPICANRLRVQKASVKKRYLAGTTIDEIIKKTRNTAPEIIKEWIEELEAENNSPQNKNKEQS